MAKASSEARRPNSRKRGYTPQWEKARGEFLKAHPTCITLECGEPASVVDHVIPHKGDQRLFWSRSNWQPMCARCHNRKTAKQDGGFGRKAT